MSEYTIDRGFGVRERMNMLADTHAPATMSLFDAVGIVPGAQCVDLGCGGGHVALELARRVGPPVSRVRTTSTLRTPSSPRSRTTPPHSSRLPA
jgi:ubiquinone/menaquinone biosynthesis C-methylase UbiE